MYIFRRVSKGLDELTVEYLKYGDKIVIGLLVRLFKRCMELDTISEDWNSTCTDHRVATRLVRVNEIMYECPSYRELI